MFWFKEESEFCWSSLPIHHYPRGTSYLGDGFPSANVSVHFLTVYVIDGNADEYSS